jgi:hypothetical protein
VQFLKKIGATSREKVGALAEAAVVCAGGPAWAPSCADATPAITDSAAAATVVRVIMRESSSAEDRGERP